MAVTHTEARNALNTVRANLRAAVWQAAVDAAKSGDSEVLVEALAEYERRSAALDGAVFGDVFEG